MMFDVFSNKNALLPVTSEGFNNCNFQNDQISLECRIPKPQIILSLFFFFLWGQDCTLGVCKGTDNIKKYKSVEGKEVLPLVLGNKSTTLTCYKKTKYELLEPLDG